MSQQTLSELETRLAAGEPTSQVAAACGVSAETVRKVRLGRRPRTTGYQGRGHLVRCGGCGGLVNSTFCRLCTIRRLQRLRQERGRLARAIARGELDRWLARANCETHIR